MNLIPRFLRRHSASPPIGSASHSGALPFPYRRFTLEDWRSSQERVAYVADLLKQPLFLDLLGMLCNVRLFQRGPIDATSAARLLGQREGSDLLISSLLAAATSPPTPPDDLPADYDAANMMAAWEREGSMDEPQ